MTHLRFARLAGALATGGLFMAAVAGPQVALAGQPAPGATVTICHASNSDARPYIRETVSISAAGTLDRGHSGHTGPLWTPALKAAHVQWGDIIPTYELGTITFDGQNLGDGGQAILDADCVVTTADETAPADGTAPADPAPTDDAAATEPAPTADATSTDPAGDPAPDATDGAAATDAPADAGALGTEQPSAGDEGEIVYDPTFITDVPDPTPASTPQDAARGVAGRPAITPPPTDTLGHDRGTTPGTGFQAVLLVLAGLSTMVLVLGRVPAARRS